MVMAIDEDIRDELRRVVSTYPTPVLETLLAVAKSFEHGIADDDEHRFYVPGSDSWVNAKGRSESRVSQRLKARGVRMILHIDGRAELLVQYNVDGTPVRNASYTRMPDGYWTDSNGPLTAVCFADLEVFYFDMLDFIERATDGQ